MSFALRPCKLGLRLYSTGLVVVRLQKTILCAVVENAQISIIFVAVSEALLSWEAYVEAVSGDGTGPGSARHDQGHCNAAVRRTVANQVSCYSNCIVNFCRPF